MWDFAGKTSEIHMTEEFFMIRVLFVCHGNICRSPMAESVCAHMIAQKGLQGKISVFSAAAHTDEIGNPPHRGTVRKLQEEGVPLVPHRAVLLTEQDGARYDYILGMDEYNVRDIRRILPADCAHKVRRLLDFSSRSRSIADPWYTGNFDQTYMDVCEGCEALLAYLAPSVSS